MATVLDYDIKFLPGVGEKRAGVLARELGIRTFGDLLYYFPFRYVDRTKLFRIGDIGPDAPAYIQVRARVTGMAYEGEGRKRRLRVFVSDGSGTADLVWFSGTKWIEKRIEAGREYIVFGRPALFRGELSFVHPEIDLVEALVNRPGGGLQGVYSTTEKLSGVQLGSKGIYKLVCNLWEQVQGHITETLPPPVCCRWGRRSAISIFRSRRSCSGRRSTALSSRSCWVSSSLFCRGASPVPLQPMASFFPAWGSFLMGFTGRSSPSS